MVVKHFLVVEWSQGPRLGRGQPNPVGGAAPSDAKLFLQVSLKGLGYGVLKTYFSISLFQQVLNVG